MMKLLHPFFITLLMFSAIGLAGCCSCGKTAESVYPPTVISVSEGGGVTGQFVGYTIDTEGTVHQWRGFAASVKDSSVLDTLTTEMHRDLLRTAYACDFPELKQYETGNMTATLEITSGELLYRFSWPGLWRSTETAPEQLRPLIEMLATIIVPTVYKDIDISRP